MKQPTTIREALIADALGEAATLLRQVEALVPAMDDSRRALVASHRELADQLATFRTQIDTISSRAKLDTVKYVVESTENVTRRTIAQQSEAMSNAARVAFGNELSANMQRLQFALQPVIDQLNRRWETWFTYVAAAMVGAFIALMAVATLLARWPP